MSGCWTCLDHCSSSHRASLVPVRRRGSWPQSQGGRDKCNIGGGTWQQSTASRTCPTLGGNTAHALRNTVQKTWLWLEFPQLKVGLTRSGDSHQAWKDSLRVYKKALQDATTMFCSSLYPDWQRVSTLLSRLFLLLSVAKTLWALVGKSSESKKNHQRLWAFLWLR